MLIRATLTQAAPFVRAMKCVCTGHGAVALSAVDVAAIKACHQEMLHRDEPLDVAALPPATPAELASLVGGGVGEHTVQFLAVVALVDGSVRFERIDAVAHYSAALRLHEDHLDELIAMGGGRPQWAIADMSRRNVVSISDSRLKTDDFALWPYREAPDPALAERYRGQAELPQDTLGRDFHRSDAAHDFPYPGEPEAGTSASRSTHSRAYRRSGSYGTDRPCIGLRSLLQPRRRRCFDHFVLLQQLALCC